MKKGSITNLNRSKGFGFIGDGQGQEYFFHKSMLSETCCWEEMEIGQAVKFTPRQGKKGPEATNVLLKKLSAKPVFSSIEDIPGDYGTIRIARGKYTNLKKYLADCDGLAFCGRNTFGGRFPNDQKLISSLREMRAVFDKENKFWFLRASLVQANFGRIHALIKEAKRRRRNQLIRRFLVGFVSSIFMLAAGMVLIAVIAILVASLFFTLHRGGPRMPSVGNIWLASQLMK